MDERILSTRRVPFSLLLLFIAFVSMNAEARRWGLAKKYTIPSMSKSHITIGQSQESELNPDSIKILVWNLLKAERKNWLGDFLNMSQDKDILLLQEGYLNSRTQFAFDTLNNFRFDMGVSFLYKRDDNTPTGTVVGSRVAPVDAGFVRTYDLEPFIKTPKTITHATYPIAGSNKTLLALSIHGINFANHHTFVNQINQAVELITAHDGPIVFGGDFNTRTKKRMKHLSNVMSFLGFKEASFRNDKRMKVFGNVLDHVFVKDLLIKDSNCLKNIKSSDHKAMVLELVYDVD